MVFMNPETARVRDDPKRTTPFGLMLYAQNFHDAALGVADTVGKLPGHEILAPIPALYLIGHSMELSLKAFLLHKGETLLKLRTKSGHNLGKCLNRAKRLGLLEVVTFDEHELAAFSALDDLYSAKELEYIVTGYKAFSIFGYIETMSQKLLTSIRPIVNAARMAQQA